MMRASTGWMVSMCFIFTPKRPYAKLLGHGMIVKQTKHQCKHFVKYPTILWGFCCLSGLTYNCRMTKQDIIKLAGSQSELARILGIERSAVCQWKTVPELRMRQLKDLRPQWFVV
jgi:hypothetical protein